MSHGATRCRTAAIAVLAVLLAGCTTGSLPGAPGSPSAPGSSSPTPSPPVSPFTGLPTDLAAPVLVVKIDNVGQARPQTGLTAADLVYVEPVEGGISRLAAVFQSQVPPVVGPVRSVRRTDVQLLANFGRPAFAFSGEAPELRPLLDRSPAVDVSAPARPGAYFREGARPRPHNLYGDAARLAPAGAPPVDIGFEFGPTPAGGRPVEATSVSYRSARIGIEWAQAQHRWVFAMDGAPLRAAEGGRPGAATVVLQRVRLKPTAIRDATGAVSPFAVTVGHGEAVVLRDGRSFQGQWSRPAPPAPTTFSRSDGTPLPLAPGKVWVILVPAPG
ncbi:MAG: DUF3048 domain-containing protein [Pseudonocardiaceae bacterium]|nr:DUF3048 domain-containing protein [Pseudonocardiaceae bacterium]